MNFLSADVEIKVDDSKLKSQLDRAKSAVTKMVDKVKGTFGRMAASFKVAFDKMVRYAKYGAIAVVGALTLMTRAAMKQEDAVFLLAAALKAAGEYSVEVMHRFKAFAASIQEVTTYGDETVLALMQLMKSLGVTSVKLEEATKMAIGLAAATGRDVQSMAMYIALAQQGEFTMLRRYIPALRSTTDATEQLRIITEFAARGFEIAQAAALTASGSLKQMWNALGDVAEQIGDALLPAIKDTATAVKKWAKDNEEEIGYWAKVTVAYIAYVKDMLVSFIKFMQEDWKAGLQFAADVSIKAWELFATKMKKLFVELGEDLGAIVKGWPKEIWEWGIGKVVPPAAGVYRKPDKQRQELAERHRRAFAIPETGTIIAEPIISKTDKVKKALESMVPPELKVRFDEATEKLKAALAGIERKAEQTGEVLGDALVAPVKEAARASEEELAKIHDVMVEEYQRVEEAKWHAMRAPIIAADKLTRETTERHKRIAEDYAAAMATAWTGAFMDMATEGKKFGAAMKDMFKELVAMILQIYMYKKIAEPIAYGIMGLPAPGTAPSAQYGGTVARTGLAVIHRGETYSGVGGGRTEVTVNYTGRERHEVSVEQSVGAFNQQIIQVNMQAMGDNIAYQNAMKRAVSH